MVAQPGGHCGCTLNPTVASAANREFEAQTVMIIAEVVQATDHEHACQQGFPLLGKVAGATRQPSQTLPEGGIEAFDVGGVDYPTALGNLQQTLNHRSTTLDDPAVNAQSACLASLDYLNNRNVGQAIKRGRPRRLSRNGVRNARRKAFT